MTTPPSDMQARLAAALDGQYVLDRMLGQGGMGTVFLARDTTLDRPVAIKVISPDVTGSAEMRERFLLEARTVARLRHPNIVSVYAAGQSDGLLWFAMEYVPGESLRERLAREPQLPAEDVAAVVHDLSLALDAAHEAGIVHRDVKPENILLDANSGRAMLTDFGVARALSAADQRLTGAGFVLGSPRYMSPEQAAGESDIDGRSDLYSLGLVAYEMLAGRPVITAATPAAVLAKQITEEPTPLRELVPDVPDALDTVIMRSLRKKPAERFARGRASAQVLEGADPDDPALGSGGHTLRASRVTTGSGARRKSRTPLLAGLAVAAVAIAGLAGTQLLSSDEPAGNAKEWLVAPFELQTGDASLTWLREGAVNMLGLTLSQWNDLRIVDYERTLDLLRAEQGDDMRRVGLEDARSVARRAAAGTVVLGQITTANDSLFVVARRYDVASGNRIDEATAGAPLSGDPRAVFEQIARQLLDLAGGPVLSMELADQTTESVEAYRFYLDGLRALNRWQLGQADSMFAQAIDIDSTFALAYYKRSLGMGWQGVFDSSYVTAAEQAVEHVERLSPRDRDVVLANRDLSVGFFASARGDVATARSRWAQAVDRLGALLARDSTDAEAWYGLADADFHAATGTGIQNADSVALLLGRSLRGFQRAIALDSTFHLAYSHLVSLYQFGASERGKVLIDGDSMRTTASVSDTARQRELKAAAQRRAKEFAVGWIAQEPDAPQAWQSLLDTYAVLQEYDSAAALVERARAEPEAYSAYMGFALPVYQFVLEHPDTIRRELERALRDFPVDSMGVRTSVPGFMLALVALTTAGPIGALDLVDSLERRATNPAASSGAFVSFPPATIRFYTAGLKLAMGAPPSPPTLRAVREGIAISDTATAPLMVQSRLQSLGVPYAAFLATGDTAFAATVRRWAGPNARFPELDAFIALDRGDSTTARTLSAQFPDSAQLGTAMLSLGSMRVLAGVEVRRRLGDLAGAVAALEAISPQRIQIAFAEPGAALYARSFLSRARMQEKLGRTADAIRSYETFISWWQSASPPLQGELLEAKASVERLRGVAAS